MTGCKTCHQHLFERAPLDLGLLVAEVIERMKPQTVLKRIDLSAQIQPDLPAVSADSDRITQVLNNLVGNALRYTDAAGSIIVRAETAGNGHSVQVSVTDTGTGIDPQDLPFVFDRFYRTDKSRARSSGGSGLGLAIVKQLVEAHGGQVGAESPAGQTADGKPSGSRFYFRLFAMNKVTPPSR
jgi:two-component system, OmpR family, sensor histidine kinase ResE